MNDTIQEIHTNCRGKYREPRIVKPNRFREGFSHRKADCHQESCVHCICSLGIFLGFRIMVNIYNRRHFSQTNISCVPNLAELKYPSKSRKKKIAALFMCFCYGVFFLYPMIMTSPYLSARKVIPFLFHMECDHD